MTTSPLSWIYLVRHAAAEARGARWPDDGRRPLSPAGLDAFAALARREAPRMRVGLVLTSGLTRARQTARLLAAADPARPPVRRTVTLEPGGGAARAVAALVRRSHPARVALVGHEPDLSELASYLTGCPPGRAFRKGAIWRLRVARVGAGGATLDRVVEPGGAAVRRLSRR